MPEQLANAGPLLMCLGIAYLMLCLVAIVAADMIFEQYVERDEMEREQNRKGVTNE